jgi:hypothetical protein
MFHKARFVTRRIHFLTVVSNTKLIRMIHSDYQYWLYPFHTPYIILCFLHASTMQQTRPIQPRFPMQLTLGREVVYSTTYSRIGSVYCIKTYFGN